METATARVMELWLTLGHKHAVAPDMLGNPFL